MWVENREPFDEDNPAVPRIMITDTVVSRSKMEKCVPRQCFANFSV